MVSYDGIVYEKDMGANSREIVSSMERYDPDKSWHPVSEKWDQAAETAAE
jgi:hypothetical protein